MQLKPKPEIYLIGDSEGTGDVAREFGIGHLPDVLRNEYGTPLVNSIFQLAEMKANYRLLCYINADIIMLDDFMDAVHSVSIKRKKILMAGQRWDLDIKEPIKYSSKNWENHLRKAILEKGVLHGEGGIDYFLFSRNLWGEIPPFALGRTVWDNWLVFKARKQKIAVIDATKAVNVIHQNHDYMHVPGGKQEVWSGLEAMRNKKLAGESNFTLLDANWLLTSKGLIRATTIRHLRRLLDSWPLLHPKWTVPLNLIKKAIIAFR
jgi:hypothetical protein